MRDVVVDHKERSRIGDDGNVDAGFRIAVPRIAGQGCFQQNPHTASRKAFRQFGVNRLKVGVLELNRSYLRSKYRHNLKTRHTHQ